MIDKSLERGGGREREEEERLNWEWKIIEENSARKTENYELDKERDETEDGMEKERKKRNKERGKNQINKTM